MNSEMFMYILAAALVLPVGYCVSRIMEDRQ